MWSIECLCGKQYAVEGTFAEYLRVRIWQVWDAQRRAEEAKARRHSRRSTSPEGQRRRRKKQPPPLSEFACHSMLKISSNPALTSLEGFRPAVAPLVINQDLGRLAFLDLSLNNLATLTGDARALIMHNAP